MPALEPDVIAALGRALDLEGVVAAYLFGSQARATAGPLSDVDIGVWHERPDPATQLALTAAVTSVLRTDAADVVLLDRAPPALCHAAVRDGVLLVERDHAARIEREVATLHAYVDTAPLRAELRRGLEHRIAEGRFGRA